MHTIQNARITLLATAFNNLALAVIVAGFIAPAASGQLHAGWQAVTSLAWIGFGTALHVSRATRARETAAMTWDQAWVWLIWPAILTAAICAGGIWASRHIP